MAFLENSLAAFKPPGPAPRIIILVLILTLFLDFSSASIFNFGLY